MKAVIAAVLVSLLAGCGGGPTPSELSTPQVLIATRQPEKRLLYRDARLNLVKHIIPIQRDSFLIVGNQLTCRVQRTGVVDACVKLPVDLWDLDVLTDSSGTPTTIVGKGGWGKPSVAVMDLKGTLKWRFDGGFDLMDAPVVAESADRGLVVVGNRTFDLSTGAVVAAPFCDCGAVASADFDQDGRRDILQARKGELRVINGSGQELARMQMATSYWEEPLVAGRAVPFVVLSTNEELAIYDRELKEKRRFQTPGARFPLHAAAATFFEPGFEGPFAVLVKGRGGWHRTILYVYAANAEPIYKEVLGDDYQSITAYSATDDTLAFLVGGRGEVWSYQFAR